MDIFRSVRVSAKSSRAIDTASLSGSRKAEIVDDVFCCIQYDTKGFLENWTHLSPQTALLDEESMQQDQDTMHCSEAWRNGLLLYIYRMFWWEPGSKAPVQVGYRARSVLDHVFACRDDMNVSKQALLPLFLAGCELTNPSLRAKIIQYCSSWSSKTGYDMFNSAIPFLEEVWADQEVAGFNNVWWGQ
ncbi:hypothetical protein D0Z07_2512, partial [Hyphodiscus hymeniophilus]